MRRNGAEPVLTVCAWRESDIVVPLSLRLGLTLLSFVLLRVRAEGRGFQLLPGK
jgi:hypothetical protein